MRRTSDAGERDAPLVKLGSFLRNRRKLLKPAALESAARRRQTPGLRREEVALRAGISVDWYTRIELGTGVVPSVATLQGIARALELDPVDTHYLFELADLPAPKAEAPAVKESIAAIEAAIMELSGVAAFVHDVYSNPLCWNAAADGLFRMSRGATDFDRNSIVFSLVDPYYSTFFGDDYDLVTKGAIGMFRRAYTTMEVPPLAQRVFDFAIGHPRFSKFWNEHSVAVQYTPPGPILRHLPEIGPVRLTYNDLYPLRRRDVMCRIIAPYDDETREKFPEIVKLGRPGRFASTTA